MMMSPLSMDLEKMRKTTPWLRLIRQAFKAMTSLLEYDTFEEVTKLVGQLGGALREIKPQSSDESMPEENQSQRARRYTQCGQSEASDPDYWADVKYGPADERMSRNHP